MMAVKKMLCGHTVKLDTSLQEVARLMKCNNTESLTIVDEDENPIGLITNRQIMVHSQVEGLHLGSATVSDALVCDMQHPMGPWYKEQDNLSTHASAQDKSQGVRHILLPN